MEKTILVITYDKDAAVYHAREIEALLGDKAVARPCSMEELRSAPVPRADLYCVTTDAIEHFPDFRKRLPPDASVVYFFVTFSYEHIQKLRQVPAGTRALFVNLNEKMALECITSLSQLGVNHISFQPYYPGAAPELARNCTLAVTPDEERYIPAGMEQVINLGQRRMDCNTVVEILLKLKFYDLLESPRIREYLASIASNAYSFNELLGRSVYLESSFQKLVDVLDTGIIGIDEQEAVFIYNRKAEQILGRSLSSALNRPVRDALPFLPFSEYSSSNYTVGSRLLRLGGGPVHFDIVPIVRNDSRIGAIAILHHFDEEEARQNKLRIQLLDKGHKAKYTFGDIVGDSPALRRVKGIAQKMARTRSSILLTGESGTGKELFAHAIHNASERKDRPFIAVNCAALPENLLESELFGYVEGAFTGAKKGGKMGLFEFAHTGTFFLDEVEGMSPALQIKLLRVLQEHEVMRIGDNRLIPVDVRVIAASNQHLEELVASGAFRQDLYYRLCTLPIDLPPLRERKEDILPLIQAFQTQLGSHFTLSPAAQQALLDHSWHGNIRELRNYVEYFSYLDRPIITPEDLPPGFYLRAKKASPLRREETSPLESLAGKRYEHYRFLLETLSHCRRSGAGTGREALARVGREQGVPLTQYEIRDILSHLEREGYVVISRGRGGTQITDAGLRLLDGI